MNNERRRRFSPRDRSKRTLHQHGSSLGPEHPSVPFRRNRCPLSSVSARDKHPFDQDPGPPRHVSKFHQLPNFFKPGTDAYYLCELFPEGFSLTSTLKMGAVLGNFRVEKHTIDYYKRHGKSSIRPIHDTISFFKIVFRLGILFFPSKVFSPAPSPCSFFWLASRRGSFAII